MPEKHDFFSALGAAQEQNTSTSVSRSPFEEIVPLAPIPSDAVLSEEQRKVLGKVQEYTRRGTMPPQLVTRQQMIEDILARGFTQLEDVKRGPFTIVRLSPEGGRAIAKKSNRPDYYDFSSRVEADYVRQRHATLFPKGTNTPQPDAPARQPTPLATGSRQAEPGSAAAPKPKKSDGRKQPQGGDEVLPSVSGTFGAKELEGRTQVPAQQDEIAPERREQEQREEENRIAQSVAETVRGGEAKWDSSKVVIGSVLTYHGAATPERWVITEIDKHGDLYAREVSKPGLAGGFVGLNPELKFTTARCS